MKGICSANLYYLWSRKDSICFDICRGMRCKDCCENLNKEELSYQTLEPLKKLFVHDPVERMAIEIHE